MSKARIWILLFCLLAVSLLLSVGAPRRAMARREPETGGDPVAPLSFSDNARNFNLVGSLDGYFLDFQIVDHFGYAAGSNGFQIIDLTDPLNPAVIWSDQDIYTMRLFVSEQIAFVSRWITRDWYDSDILELYDVSDPVQPIKIGEYSTCIWSEWGFCHELHFNPVYVSGEIVYLAITIPEALTAYQPPYYYLYILDVSDPAHPEFLTSFKTYESVRGVVVRDGLAFFTDGNLHILDVSEPAYPAEIGYLNLDGIATDILLEGDFAFIASETGGIFSVDISDPAHPVQIGAYELIDHRYDYSVQIPNMIAIQGKLAYVSDWNHGLRAFYIQDPEHPGEVGHYPAERKEFWVFPPSLVALTGNLIFFSLGQNLEILQYTGPEAFYQVSGQVTTMAGKPIPHVIVYDGEGRSVRTGADGIYTLSGLEAGSHTLAPVEIGYAFSPSERTVSVPPDATGLDFVVELYSIFLPFAGGR